MAELVDAQDLISRENCSKKSDFDSNINCDGFVPHTVNNPADRTVLTGSIPVPSTL